MRIRPSLISTLSLIVTGAMDTLDSALGNDYGVGHLDNVTSSYGRDALGGNNRTLMNDVEVGTSGVNRDCTQSSGNPFILPW